MQDIVYVLVNEAMPNYVKVGSTANLEQRMRDLDTTGVPLPFECFYAARVNDARFVERRLHDAFMNHRVRKNREFFEIAPERIMAALKLAEIEDVTPGADYLESEFEGEQTSLSAAAQKALQNAGLSWKAVQGPMYWKYEDETLGERRYRMETED